MNAPSFSIKKMKDEALRKIHLCMNSTPMLFPSKADLHICSIDTAPLTTIPLSKLFPSVFMFAINDGNYEVTPHGVSRCFFKTSRGRFCIFAVRNSACKVRMGACGIINCLICDRDPNGPEDQEVYVVGVPLNVCTACDQVLFRSYTCKVCKDAGLHVKYCSKHCQVQHWPTHKAECGIVTRLIEFG